MNELQTRRRETLVALASEFWLDEKEILEQLASGRFTSTATEDLAPYLRPDDPVEIERFALVTKHDDGRFVMPDFDWLEQAFDRACRHVDSDVFTEYPVTVVDLDSGKRWLPGVPLFNWNEDVR